MNSDLTPNTPSKKISSLYLLIKNVETRRGFKNSKKLETTPSWTHGTSLIKAPVSDGALEALKAESCHLVTVSCRRN